MKTLRKLQLLSAVVIANGVVALLAMSPQEAQAAACESQTMCFTSLGCYVFQYVCSPPPGCQFVSGSCGAHCAGGGTLNSVWLTCNYAPL